MDNDTTPKPKVVAATLGAAVATLIVWLIQLLGGIEVPVGVEGSIATIAAFFFGYMKTE